MDFKGKGTSAYQNIDTVSKKEVKGKVVPELN
jgi:hypothetical protein